MDTARPTQEIERDFRVRHPSSLQVRGTREENEGRRRTMGTREKWTKKKKKTRTWTRRRQQRQQHDVAALIWKKGDQPPLKSTSKRGSSHPYKRDPEGKQSAMNERKRKRKQTEKETKRGPHPQQIWGWWVKGVVMLCCTCSRTMHERCGNIVLHPKARNARGLLSYVLGCRGLCAYIQYSWCGCTKRAMGKYRWSPRKKDKRWQQMHLSYSVLYKEASLGTTAMSTL